MDESTSVVRADIEATRSRMSRAITELERKVDVKQKIKDNPWPALAIAFGAGLALSVSGADTHAGRATADATQKTGSKVGSALDDMLATAVGGIAAAFQGQLDDAVKDVVASIKGDGHRRTTALEASGVSSAPAARVADNASQAVRPGLTARAD